MVSVQIAITIKSNLTSIVAFLFAIVSAINIMQLMNILQIVATNKAIMPQIARVGISSVFIIYYLVVILINASRTCSSL